MTRVVVDLARLAELIDRMEVVQAQLAAARHEVAARTRGLHGSWVGAAATAQAATHAEWDAGAAEVHAALATLRAIASDARANYLAAIVANRRMWAQ